MDYMIYAQDRVLNGDLQFFKSKATDPIIFVIPIVLGFLFLTLYLLMIYMNKNFKIPKSNAFGYALISIFLSVVMGIPYFYLGYKAVGVCLIILPLFLIPIIIHNIIRILNIPIKNNSTDNLSRERDKIFQLLDDGKINAQEAKELLNAIYEPIEKNSTEPQSAPNNQGLAVSTES